MWALGGGQSLQATGATRPGHVRGGHACRGPHPARLWAHLRPAHSAQHLCSVLQVYPVPRSKGECLSNILEFLRGCQVSLQLETSDANDLYQGQNFNKVLSSLVTLNKVTADIGLGSDSMCAWPSSHQIKSSHSLGLQPSR